ncbi:Rha family transcriptional regulator [Bordetella bronchialis]|uniref:Rha family transcriptional regulator n=1 Tax=Bordetella bronchialis TaxID=463025 RepID=UPI003D07C494
MELSRENCSAVRGSEHGEQEGFPSVAVYKGCPMVTSLQIAEHFGKRHRDVLRAIRNLGCSCEFNERNFALVDYIDEKGEVRPVYHITRDGFAILAMGFTGKPAMRWKEAYIQAFNLMEAKLRELHVAPLLEHKEFRASIKLKDKLTLQAQSRTTVAALEAETSPRAKRNLYWQLRQINDTLGIPTDSMQAWLGADALDLPISPDQTATLGNPEAAV